jgi:hypothetical protein
MSEMSSPKRPERLNNSDMSEKSRTPLVSAYALIGEVDNGGDVTRLYYRIGSPHAGHAALGAVDDPDS